MSVRLIPAAIFVAVLMLTVRVGDLWSTVDALNDDKSASSRATAEATRAGLDIGGRAQAQENGEEPAAAPDGEMAAETEAKAEAGADPMTADGAENAPTDNADADVPDGMQPLEMTSEEAPDFTDEENLRPGELRLMHDLAKRREQLEARDRALDEREAILAAAEQKLVDKQRQLQNLRRQIENLVSQYDQAQEEETSILRQTYQNMKSKAAASIFNDLEMETLLNVVRGMPARRLAPILADMAPEKARLVTRELSLREELPNLPQ